MLNQRNVGPALWAGLVAAALLGSAACQDLSVANTTAPDRNRATRNPSDVEAFIGGAFFPSMWTALHSNGTIATAFPNIASEFTFTGLDQGTLLWWEDVMEPRQAHDNGAFIYKPTTKREKTSRTRSRSNAASR